MSKKQKKFTVKSYKTISGRQLFFIKSKTFINSCYFNRNLKFFKYKSDDERFKSCSIRYKYSIEDIKLAEKKVIKEKSKKKKIWSIIFILLNVAIVVGIIWSQLSNGEAASIDELFSLNLSWKFIVFALLLVIANQIIEATKTFQLIYISTHRFRPFLSYKSTSLCRYYDAITPMSTGGEPFQMFYLKNRGVRGEVATSIPIVKSLFWQISNTLLCICLLIFNTQAYFGLDPLIITVAWVSIAVNFLILLVIFVLSISKKIGPRIVIGILKFLSKIHIIKNYQTTFRKVMRFVLNYQTCMRSFTSNIFTVLTQIVLALAEILTMALVPYFIYRTFITVPQISALDMITRTIICNLVSYVIPIPGGSGVAEYSFLAMFSALFSNKTAIWAMLIWRILCYYVLIIRGISITIYDGVYGNKKSERLVKSGYFNEKIHFAMIRKKQKKSRRVEERIEARQLENKIVAKPIKSVKKASAKTVKKPVTKQPQKTTKTTSKKQAKTTVKSNVKKKK